MEKNKMKKRGTRKLFWCQYRRLILVKNPPPPFKELWKTLRETRIITSCLLHRPVNVIPEYMTRWIRPGNSTVKNSLFYLWLCSPGSRLTAQYITCQSTRRRRGRTEADATAENCNKQLSVRADVLTSETTGPGYSLAIQYQDRGELLIVETVMNSVTSPRANYTDRATAPCRWS
jgi:hypothetical protein